MSKNGLLSEPVLTLNANFEPLNVCTTKRALMLVLTGKAEIIINGRGYVHSASTEFEIPSVIKLGAMIQRPRPRVALSKREVLRRDNYTCQYCGSTPRFLTIDHIQPRHLNGPHSWENLVAACVPCNRKKGGKTLDKANMPLRRKPQEPRPSAMYRFGKHLQTREEWKQFIEGW